MIQELPISISVFFIVIVLVTIIWFYIASGKSPILLAILIIWSMLQSTLALTGFFLDTSTLPPRLVAAGLGPALLMIAGVFLFKKSRRWLSNFNLKLLTYFHSIRVLVEIVLYFLFVYGFISKLQTIEGTNYDLLSGLSAPIIAYLAFNKKLVGKKGLMVWNLLAMVLLLNVVITSALAAPFPFQQLSFDQPNVAVLYFPFNLLPSVVVPLVLFAHLIAIYRLAKTKVSH